MLHPNTEGSYYIYKKINNINMYEVDKKKYLTIAKVRREQNLGTD